MGGFWVGFLILYMHRIYIHVVVMQTASDTSPGSLAASLASMGRTDTPPHLTRSLISSYMQLACELA